MEEHAGDLVELYNPDHNEVDDDSKILNKTGSKKPNVFTHNKREKVSTVSEITPPLRKISMGIKRSCEKTIQKQIK